MKIKILILTAFSLLLLWSCTPEVEEDSLTIYSENNSVYAKYSSSISADPSVVLVKTRYSSFPYRNGVSLGDTSYSANTLFFQFDRETDGSLIWFKSEILSNDSNVYVAKWDDINETMHIKYDDTLVFVKNLRNASLDDTVTFNSVTYPNIESFDLTLSTDSTYIDSLNNGQWYETYRSWKDDMINLYR
ncbi:MAG: hypothetical protein PF638_00820 [Candidatus Delongbacteria bacterium]|jgi:hypothetical protein|nr:hypothetical protein [Candidatus Delongbacteria bacterium]